MIDKIIAEELIKNRFKKYSVGKSFPDAFSKMTLEIHDKFHIQTRSVEPKFEASDQFATLGTMAFHAIPYGKVEKKGNNKKCIIINKLGYYVKDKYRFENETNFGFYQPLGFWDKSNKTVDDLPSIFYLFYNQSYISNNDFIQYAGGDTEAQKRDFDIFSDVKIDELSKPVVIEMR